MITDIFVLLKNILLAEVHDSNGNKVVIFGKQAETTDKLAKWSIDCESF